MEEIWKDIDGYEGLYQVSNMGRVKSLGRYKIARNNSISFMSEIIKKTQISKKGYITVTLNNNKQRKTFKVHRLVAQAFLDNPDNLPQINHKDEDKTNNVIWVNDDGSIDYNKSNLEWCDNKYNCNYGNHSINISKKLKRHPSIIKSVLQLNLNEEYVKIWDSSTDICEILGYNKTCISECCNGKQKTDYGYKWVFADEYEPIPFKVFDLQLYRKKVA